MGALVKGYALEPESPDYLYYQIYGDSLCDSVIADIRDRELLKEELHSFAPDIIFHLAAQPLVRFSYEVPEYTIEVNTLGSVYLLSAVRELDRPCTVVLVTTDKVYENRETNEPYSESEPLGGRDPYSASKAASEILIKSYIESFFPINRFEIHNKSFAVVRAGNVIGGGDWSKDRIIPDVINALKSNKTIYVRNPDSVRPWQHVLEPLAGYLYLAMRISEDPLKYSGAWNFGPSLDDILDVRGVVEKAVETWGGGRFTSTNIASDLHEAKLLRLDTKKVLEVLGWHPVWNSIQAIEKTIIWYKNWLNGEDAADLMKKDINEYLDSNLIKGCS
jgi:CDP-glucose 4,6-dehydratase